MSKHITMVLANNKDSLVKWVREYLYKNGLLLINIITEKGIIMTLDDDEVEALFKYENIDRIIHFEHVTKWDIEKLEDYYLLAIYI